VTNRIRERWRLLLLLSVLVAGCNLPGKPREDDRPKPADQVMDFAVLYATRCAGCHGAKGNLGPAPPLNDPLFLALATDAELLRVIREGRVVTPGQKSPMPAFARSQGGPLTDAQTQALAEGIKPRWGAPASGSQPPDIRLTGGKTGDIKKGAVAFARACAGCHGKEGAGIERDGTLHRRINDPAFLALISDQALRRIIITGRPDLGMPAYNDPDRPPVTAPEIDDLVTLLASWRSQSGE
jgi:mono/diheme cytochrome c family protein